MKMTVFADASHCPRSKGAGWGAWARRDGWDMGLTFGGPIKATMNNSAEAECAALANAIVRLSNQGHLTGVTWVMLQSDCLRVLQLLVQEDSRFAISDHKDGAAIEPQPLNPKPMEAKAIGIIIDLLKAVPKVYVRHVRGHTPGGGRAWVNEQCDRIARQHMLIERERIFSARHGGRSKPASGRKRKPPPRRKNN